MAAKPAAGTRLSPGVYADGKGGTTNSKSAPKANAKSGAKGILANPPPKSSGNAKQVKDKYTGLNKSQNFAINQRQQADISLGDAANNQLDQIYGNFNQPFDWSSLPQAPGAPDWSQVSDLPTGNNFNAWRDDQIQAENAAFDSRNEPAFAKQAENFRQRMANQGIPENSKAYADAFKAEIGDPQNDARTQAYAAARQGASSNASQFANVGFQANNQGMNNQLTKYSAGNQVYQDAYGRQQAQRNQPLNDFNSLYGSTSPFATQNLAYSQGLGTANNAGRIANSMRGGGGGGSGGGGSPASPFDINTDPATQRWLYQQQYLNANQPQQSGPSYGSQLAGGIFGSFAGGLGQSFGKYLGS